jgi:outer membrane biosynthesis protein TonB
MRLQLPPVCGYNMSSMKRFFLTTSLIALLLLPSAVPAEVIHLKDGTTIKVSKTWEDGGWVRFYLQDYDGIVITYAKDIIDRIESDDGRVLKTYAAEKPPETEAEQKPKAGATKPEPSKAAAAEPTKSKPEAPAATAGKKTVKTDPAQKPPKPQPAKTPPPAKAVAAPTATAPKPAPVPAAKPKQALPPPAGKPQPPKAAAAAAQPAADTPPVRDAYSAYEGVLFYNPRREDKYWSGPNTRHRTLKEAVAALAKKFDRSPQWVQQHLGDTNDLAQIYRNLSGSPEKKTVAPAPTALAANGVLFYDPRRHYKFQLSEKLKFRTLDEATAALARQYDRSPQWVKQNLGETNDVGEIHRNLARAKAAETQ